MMRKLIEQKIFDAVADGFDLGNMEFSPPTDVTALPTLSDQALLDIYDEIFGFTG